MCILFLGYQKKISFAELNFSRNGQAGKKYIPKLQNSRDTEILSWNPIFNERGGNDFFSLYKLDAKSLQPCLMLWDLMDYSSPGSSVHGILQTRILEWVAMPSFRGSFPPRNWTHVSYVSCMGQAGSLPPAPPGKPEKLDPLLQLLLTLPWSSAC